MVQLPGWVPSGQMGAGLVSWISLLSGQFHLSTRQIQRFLQEQWQLRFSVGAISQAQGKVLDWLGPLHRQIGAYACQAEVAPPDETSHYRCCVSEHVGLLATSLPRRNLLGKISSWNGLSAAFDATAWTL
jgi:hypothetical protein